MTQTTPTSDRPTVHPDWTAPLTGYTVGSKQWADTSERIYRALYPTSKTGFPVRYLNTAEDAGLFDADAVEELPDDMGEWS